MSQNAFSRTIKVAKRKISKNSTTILTAITIAGTISTGVLAFRAGTKAARLIDAEQGIEARVLTKKEKLQLTWKLYIPIAISGAITIASVIGGNRIHVKRYTALAGAYTIANSKLKEYQKKVIDTIGVHKEEKIRADVNQDYVNANPPKDESIILTGNGDKLCCDSLSGRYFKSDIEAIRKALNDLNEELLRDNTLTLNDLYSGIGLAYNELGYTQGWNIEDGLIEIKFTSALTEKNEPCIVLNYNTRPRELYNMY